MNKFKKLKAYWIKKENCVGVDYPLGILTKCDANYLLSKIFTTETLNELKSRGYDVTTIKFSIEIDVNSETYQSKFPSFYKKDAEEKVCKKQ